MARFGPLGVAAWAREMLAAGPLRVPKDQRQQAVVRLLPSLGQALHLQGPGLQVEEVMPTPRLLFLEPVENRRATARIGCKVSFLYQSTEVHPSRSEELVPHPGRDSVIRRNIEAESRALKQLLDCGLKRAENGPIPRSGWKPPGQSHSPSGRAAGGIWMVGRGRGGCLAQRERRTCLGDQWSGLVRPARGRRLRRSRSPLSGDFGRHRTRSTYGGFG